MANNNMMEEVRVCKYCNIEYPITEFKLARKNSDKRGSMCRLCRNAKEREYYANNPEQGRERRNRWARNHREQKIAQVKKWHDNNKDKCRASARNWHKRNPQYNRNYYITHTDENRYRHIKNLYGLTPDECDQLFVKQDGRCAICGKDACEMNRYFNVDHDHSTGGVRGLLCINCNRILGNSFDNIDILRNAINYLGAI